MLIQIGPLTTVDADAVTAIFWDTSERRVLVETDHMRTFVADSRDATSPENAVLTVTNKINRHKRLTRYHR